MTLGYCAGAVWTGQIDFGDGTGERKKYFVLLNDCLDGEQFFVALTTSQTRYGETPSPCGCPNAPCYRIEPREVACFTVRTWIQFDNSGYLSRAGLENLTKEGKVTFLQMLDEDKIRSVLACAKKSLDIPRRNLALIDRTLREKLEQRKTTAEKKTPIPTSLPSTASKEVLAVRAQFNQRCTSCRTEFVVLLGIAEADLVPIFLGSKPPPVSFLGDAEVGFALMTCAVCAP